MFCSNCGAPNVDGSKHCANCGRALQNELVAAQTGAAAAPAPAPQQSPQQSPQTTAYSPWLDVAPMSSHGGTYQPLPYAPTDGKATASLVLGILSILGFTALTGVPAVILGHISRSNINRSGGRLQGKGVALGGLITGYIGISIIPFLIVASIMMPNLLRARQSANASSAAATLRTVNTAQVIYSTANPAKGYALDLATLGANTSAGIDRQLSRNYCQSGTWCIKNKYKYSLTGFCNVDGLCTDYVIVATPLDGNVATRSFCSTSDAVIRSKRDTVLSEPMTTINECAGWEPFQ